MGIPDVATGTLDVARTPHECYGLGVTKMPLLLWQIPLLSLSLDNVDADPWIVMAGKVMTTILTFP